MANLQVKNVPEALFRKIRREAQREGRTIRDFVLDAIRSKLSREEFAARISRRRPVELGRRAAIAVDEIRSERDRGLGT